MDESVEHLLVSVTPVPTNIVVLIQFLTLAFKESRKIEGITTIRKEHRLSQYADDTSVFPKASERNLRNSLKILNWFYSKSGLKINIHKTKVIRIGPIRETNRRFCRENNLDWVSSFTALRITYDVLNLQTITDTNINLKIASMKKLIQSWSCRNISPIGRVTIFKSLIMSKIIHILQSLPSPTKEHFKELEKIAINFIWHKKRHQVNKEVLCRSPEKGGLGMFNLAEFDFSLKIAWLYKLQNEPEWLEYAIYEKVDRLIWTGENYHKLVLSKTANPFWSNVIAAYTSWFSIAKSKLLISPSFELLWGNTITKIPFNREMYENNFVFAKVLFNQNVLLLTKEQIDIRIGRAIMFTTYFALCEGIPKNWKNFFRDTPRDTNMIEPPPPPPVISPEKKQNRDFINQKYLE